MSSSINASGCSSLRSGLCIAIPTLDSESTNLERYETALLSRATSASTFSSPSKTQPIVKCTASQSGKNAYNMHSCPIPKAYVQRSSTGMRGLLLAETGGGLVELDPLGSGSGFKQGTAIVPGLVTPGGGTSNGIYPSSVCHRKRFSKAGSCQRLIRHATLLSQDVTPARNAAELKSLLGNSKLKIKPGAKLLPPMKISQPVSPADADSDAVILEQGRTRARLEVDILLDSEVCVEGGYLRGRLYVKVRKVRGKDAAVSLAGGKMRVVGYEGIPGNKDRHAFYQYSASLSAISASSHILYSSSPDKDGYSQACEGQHIIPFAMRLPISEDIHVGAKGPFDNRSGVMVKYIAIASFKLKDDSGSKHSIAHFYRGCEIYPYFNSVLVLAPAAHPLLSAAARSVFLGGPGMLKLTANLHRNVWVAGQRCCVEISVDNESKKFVKGLTLSLIRTTTMFCPRPDFLVASSNSAAPDACQTTTTRKLVAETTLEAGQRGLRGHVTEKGWWIGVDPGVRARFTHFILLPHDTLSIVRSRLVEVSYAIRVSLIAGSLSSEVSVMLPLHIINHWSIDPPPSYPSSYPGVHAPVPPLLVHAVGLDTATSIPPFSLRSENSQGVEFGTMPGLGGGTAVSNGEIARNVLVSDVADTTAAVDGDAVPEHIPPCQHAMPRLDEEGLDVQGTQNCASFIASRPPRTDASEDWSICMSQDRNLDDDFSDDSGSIDAMDVDDLTTDLLRELNLDDNQDSFVGSIELDNDDKHKLTMTADISQAVRSRNIDSQTIVSAKRYTDRTYEGHTSPEYGLSRMLMEKITVINSPRPTLGLKESHHPLSQRLRSANPYGSGQGPISKATAGSSEAYMARNTKTSPIRSWQGYSTFSQRVEKLVAARRAAITLIANPTTVGTETKNCSGPSDKGKQPEAPLSTLYQPYLCAALAAPTSTSSIECPLNITSSHSQMVTSDGGTIISSSLSGSVRARVAELEERAAVAGRPNFGRVPGRIM